MLSFIIISRNLLLGYGLSLISMTLSAQQSFQLEFGELQWEEKKVNVDVFLSFTESGKLGTSNFVFDYDYRSIANPVLIGHNLPDPYYSTPNVKSVNGSIATLNIELLIAGKGMLINSEPTYFATLQFDRIDQNYISAINWRKDIAPRTEIFLDDNSSQITQGKYIDFVPSALPAKGLVGEMAIVLTNNQKQAFVEFESQRSGKYTLELIDENGSVLHMNSYDFRIGKNSVMLNTAIFSSGSNTVRLLFEEEERLAAIVFSK